MRSIFYMLFLLPVFCLGQAPSQNDDKITIGTKQTIYSTILNEDREVWVYVPESARADSKTRYPVMYLLDGKDFFHSMYTFLGSKQYDKAYSFFKMNIDNYPTSSNVYDSMGDYYLEKNNKKRAIESFKKALSLKEVAEIRKKLETLQAKI